MELIIDEAVNKKNIELFKMYDTQRPNKKRYRCCVCKEPVSISESFSNKGDRLICSICSYKIFKKDVFKMFRWIRRETDEV